MMQSLTTDISQHNNFKENFVSLNGRSLSTYPAKEGWQEAVVRA